MFNLQNYQHIGNVLFCSNDNTSGTEYTYTNIQRVSILYHYANGSNQDPIT